MATRGRVDRCAMCPNGCRVIKEIIDATDTRGVIARARNGRHGLICPAGTTMFARAPRCSICSAGKWTYEPIDLGGWIPDFAMEAVKTPILVER
jgi:hypothetical protein